ncbi:MAG: flippase-like domain-containing protein [Anaerolineaceae bacterium]|nr:flippase-like domain-containing protein [Anaerolineaceae bacterium]MBN2676565.1 flippase-like domain-containing protein [Anaerolineaceae bacterium]
MRLSKNVWINASIILVVLIYVVYIIITQGKQVVELKQHYNFLYTLSAFLVVIPGTVIAIIAWRNMLSAFQVRRKLRDDIKVYCVSMIGSILPGGIWGIVGRTSLYKNIGAHSINVASASILESIIVGVSGLFVYTGITVFQPTNNIINSMEIGIVVGIVCLILIQPPIFNRLISWVLHRFDKNHTPKSIEITMINIITWLGLETMVCIIGGFAVYLFLNSFYPLAITSLQLIISAWALSTVFGNLLFWLPGKLVFRDGIFVLALSTFMSLPLAITSVVAIRIWSILSILLNALLASSIYHLHIERLILRKERI